MERIPSVEEMSAICFRHGITLFVVVTALTLAVTAWLWWFLYGREPS